MPVEQSKTSQVIIQILALIERVVTKRSLSRSHHRDEVEKHLMYLLQGRDTLDPYERRAAGVTDEEWSAAISSHVNLLRTRSV